MMNRATESYQVSCVHSSFHAYIGLVNKFEHKKGTSRIVSGQTLCQISNHVRGVMKEYVLVVAVY